MDENFTFPSETTDLNENVELYEYENSILQIQEKKIEEMLKSLEGEEEGEEANEEGEEANEEANEEASEINGNDEESIDLNTSDFGEIESNVIQINNSKKRTRKEQENDESNESDEEIQIISSIPKNKNPTRVAPRNKKNKTQ